MTHQSNFQDGTGIAEFLPNIGIAKMYGPNVLFSGVPANGIAGFAPGCEFVLYTGTSGAEFYINQGTSLSCLFVALPANQVLQQAFTIPLSEMRAAGTMAVLGNTAGTPSGALGITAGTFGTALPVLVGEAGATKTDVARFQFMLPYNFVPGGNINFQVNAQEETATDGTLSLNAYATAGGSNLGGAMTGTMAATASNFTRAIATTGLVGGQVLDCEISAVTVTSGTITINTITALVDVNN